MPKRAAVWVVEGSSDGKIWGPRDCCACSRTLAQMIADTWTANNRELGFRYRIRKYVREEKR